MSVACPVSLDRDRLKAEVRETYTRVATDPNGAFHFHRGPEYAISHLHYDRDEIGRLPAANTAAFAGLGNPLAVGPVHPGEIVLDVGSGGGTDLLLAAHRTGPSGRAIGVDMTPGMVALALQGARALNLTNVEVREGDFERLPVEPASVDVVISNGVLNLAPDKERVYSEIARVLKPGGRLYLADVAAEKELGEEIRSDFELWAA